MAGKKYIAILTPAGEAKMAAAAISGSLSASPIWGWEMAEARHINPMRSKRGWLMSFIVPRLTAWSLPTVVQT